MTKQKVRISRLTTAGARQVTYSKRMIGLAKKAKELAILCDIELALVTFSPAGKGSLILGENSEFGEVLERFLRIDRRERDERKRKILEVLKKNCKKQDHEVNMELFSSEGSEKAEEYINQLKGLQAVIIEKNKTLSFWNNPEDINDKLQISTMEELLVKSLKCLQLRKGYLEERQALTNPATLELGELICSNMSKGRNEDMETGLNLSPFEQPNCDSVGLENLKQGIELNLGRPYFSHIDTSGFLC